MGGLHFLPNPADFPAALRFSATMTPRVHRGGGLPFPATVFRPSFLILKKSRQVLTVFSILDTVVSSGWATTAGISPISRYFLGGGASPLQSDYPPPLSLV